MWAHLGFSPGLGISGNTGNFRNTSCVVASPAVNIHDTELIKACLAGKTDAFGQLVVRHQDRLYNTLAKVLGSADDARDVSQQAFVHAFQKLHTFRGNSAFYSWLFRIAMNAAISEKRKTRRMTASVDLAREQSGEEPTDFHPDSQPSHAIELSERQQMVQTALAELSEEFRTVLVLKEMEGLKYEEIAEIVGCPVGTVRSRIHRARSEMREKLRILFKAEVQ
ncbi:MAG: sigma-70 family RNA polymerase sigma factor [Planctomycetaceae bacterium]|jgi:RNA polymerase sigma-70 factor, ECF subfamily|nr:sigma-70 family RNA polymerase sigma factor [Planctomycetaceae bacterium]MBT6154526.1 sigma-70 family RNA polymerase sigma factor [Planctomycetaceae bacterium]MBT6486556.1 sigma-70 family RNA polymerase sigma factor [Planctomycetaceae bacterium]MBT6496815.1 sigma-70 family RNA polymerase sigma factor [Planctomycetaceae bacterium]